MVKAEVQGKVGDGNPTQDACMQEWLITQRDAKWRSWSYKYKGEARDLARFAVRTQVHCPHR